MPRLVAFVGPSGCGKTTLIEKLIPALHAQGLKVGVIKNDAHGFQIDREGKDSDRLYKTGADGVLIQSPAALAYRQAHSDRQEPEALAKRFFTDCDLVIVEGAKWTDLPKIEVWRSAVHPARLDPPPSNLVACVCDAPDAARSIEAIPATTWDDISFVARLVNDILA